MALRQGVMSETGLQYPITLEHYAGLAGGIALRQQHYALIVAYSARIKKIFFGKKPFGSHMFKSQGFNITLI